MVSRFENSWILDFFTYPPTVVDNLGLPQEIGSGAIETVMKVGVAATAVVISFSHFCFPTIFCFSVKYLQLESVVEFLSRPWNLVAGTESFAGVKKLFITALSVAVVAGVIFSLSYTLPLSLMLVQYAALDMVILSNVLAHTISEGALGNFYSARFFGLFNTSKNYTTFRHSINRGMLNFDPICELERYATRLAPMMDEYDLAQIRMQVEFDGEVGVDMSGLSKDFYSTMFASLVSTKKILLYTQADVDRSNADLSLQSFYRAVALMMVHAGTRRDVVIGSSIDSSFYKALEVLLPGEFARYKNESTPYVEKQKVEYKVALALLPYFDVSMRDNLEKQLKFLLEIGDSSDEIVAYAVNTNRFMQVAEERGLDEDNVMESPGDYAELIKECIAANCTSQVETVVTNFMTIVEGMDECLKGFGRYSSKLANMKAIDFEAHIGGVLDRDMMIAAINVDLPEGRDTTEFSRKIEMLKGWLKDVATREDLKTFLSFYTGSSAFIPGSVRITFSPTYVDGQYTTAATCFNKGELSGIVNPGVDDTPEDFGRCLMLTMRGGNEGFTMA